MTPTQQRNAISEGTALGLIILGQSDLPYDKVTADLAFTGAFRGWAYADKFPQVRTDLSKGSDGARVMTRATESKQTFVFFWKPYGQLTVRNRQDNWDPADPKDIDYAVSVIDGDVPAAGWIDLASRFLERYLRHLNPQV